MKWALTFYIVSLPVATIGQPFEEHAVAAVLMAEAWSEGVGGMTAVGEVIHQRSREKGCTPLEVVSARRGRWHAFSCLNGATINQLIGKFRAGEVDVIAGIEHHPQSVFSLVNHFDGSESSVPYPIEA